MQQLANRSLAIIVAAVLALVGATAYLSNFAPALFQDDWSEYVWAALNNQQFFVQLDRRPLLFLPRRVLFETFGLNVTLYYVVLFLLLIMAALQYYRLLERLVPRRRSVTLIAALLFLLYPADYSHMWLSTIHLRIAMCLSLAYAALFLTFMQTQEWRWLIGALIGLIASLLFYEAGLAVTLLWGVLLLSFKSFREHKNLLGVGLVLLTGAIYTVARTTLLQQTAHSDRYVNEISLDPITLIQRLVLGAKIQFWAYSEVAQQRVALSSSAFQLILIALMVATVLLVARFVIWAIKRQSPTPVRDAGFDKSHELRQAAVFAGAGVIFALAGYIPLILLYTPNLTNTASRVNAFAAPGAAAALAGMAWFGATLLGQTRVEVTAYTVAGAIPFITLALITQMSVQRDHRIAWIEQKDIWHQLFTLCPDITEDTTVILALPGYQDRFGYRNWKLSPLSLTWEVSDALRVLYSDNSLSGSVYLPDVPEVKEGVDILDGSIRERLTGEILPNDNLLLLSYQGNPRRLHLVQDDDSALVGSTVIGANNPERCLQHSVPVVPTRSLVAWGLMPQ